MFATPVDIANVALQNLGQPRIASFAENSRGAQESAFCYDKLRQDELRSHVWRFASRRAALRPVTATSYLLTFATWAIGTTYSKGMIVLYTPTNSDGQAVPFISLAASNTGNAPDTTPLWWEPYFGSICADAYSSGNTYSVGEIVGATSTFYLSWTNANIGNTSSGGTPWSANINATGTLLWTPYPITQVTSLAGSSRTQYRLPFGYLRVAPQDAKTAGVAYQVTSAGMQFSDYQLEGNYLLTSQATLVSTLGPIIFRFVADINAVPMFDPLFSRALAARMAFEMCETLTQNPKLKQDCGTMYDRFVAEAKSVNQIEQGQTDPADADFPLARIPSAAPRGGGGQIGHTINVGG